MKENRTSIAEICKNPLNIRFNPRNNWKGGCGEYRGFQMFRSESYGVRAAYVILTNYIKNGCNTIESIISRWAPPCENNTQNYINFVENDTLIPRTLELTDLSIHDYWTKLIILRSMAKMESGKDFDEQQINLYVNYPEKYE